MGHVLLLAAVLVAPIAIRVALLARLDARVATFDLLGFTSDLFTTVLFFIACSSRSGG